MNRIAFVAVSISFALLGCRGDDTTGDDQPGMDSGSNAGDVTIQEIQNDAMASGTAVELRGVVVTAIDTYGSRTGDLYVSEPEGGPFSGVKVFGASLSDIATLQVGDLVDITNAEKHEACTEAAPCGTVIFRNGAGLTEVQGVTQGSLVITKRGTGTVPTPATVDAKAIAELAMDQQLVEWEKWEGVLVNVQNARQLSAYEAFDTGDDQKQFSATSGFKVQSSLTDLGTPVTGTCYNSITGIGDFFFDYLVLPRTTADLAGGGTGCAVLSTTTIAAVQAGTATGAVQLNDVYVTAVASNKKNIWVSQTLTAAANQGLYIRGTGANFPATVTPGAKVNVLGTVTEFNNDATGDTLTQLTSATVEVTAAPTVAPTPVSNQTLANLLASGTGEPYESVLVSLANVKVTAAPGSFGITDLALYPGNMPFKADDEIYLFVAGDVGACYATITGIWTYSAFDNQYEFLPLGVGTGTGTCN